LFKFYDSIIFKFLSFFKKEATKVIIYTFYGNNKK